MPLRLRIVSENSKLLGDADRKEFVACGGSIGRALDNDWVLPDTKRYVSGRHALIDFQGGAYYIVDVSRNGVFVNESDTPVGRGHPQRLFDGDRLRIGNFDMIVEITDTEKDAANEVMRDSVVRAQQVQEDPSVELLLVDEDKIVEHDALEKHLSGSDGSSRLTHLSEIIELPSLSTAESEQRALDALLDAAGIEAHDLPGKSATEILRTAGSLLRLMVTGLTDLLQERAHLKESFRISQTLIQREQNNPLKFSPGPAEALKYLLGNQAGSYLPAEDAVKASFDDLRQHHQAMYKAMGKALQDFMERLDPEELQSRFDRGLKRNSLLAGANKLKYWELYSECFHILTHHEEGRLPETFSEEFARAYEEEIRTTTPTRRAG